MQKSSAQRLFQAPSGDERVIAAEQNFRGANFSSIFRACIVRMIQQFVVKGVFRSRGGIAQNAGNEAQHGINDDCSGDFTAGEDEVADGDFGVNVFVDEALVKAFVAPAPQGDARFARKLGGEFVVEGRALRAEVDVQRFVAVSIDGGSGTRQRFVLHHHAGATAKGTVIDTLVAVVAVAAGIPVMQAGGRIVFGKRTSNDALVEPVAHKLGEDGDDVDAHVLFAVVGADLRPFGFPIHAHQAVCEVNCLNVARADEGNEDFGFAVVGLDDKDVIRASFKEFADSAKGDALPVLDTQPDEVSPVVFAVLWRGQLVTADVEGVAAKRQRLVAVVDASESSDQSFAGGLPAQELQGNVRATVLPGNKLTVLKKRFAGATVRMDFHLPANTVYANDAADDDVSAVVRHVSSLLLVLFDQTFDAIAGLSTNADPVVVTVKLNAQGFFLAFGDGVEEAEAFDEASVTSVAAVGGNDMIKRTFF